MKTTTSKARLKEGTRVNMRLQPEVKRAVAVLAAQENMTFEAALDSVLTKVLLKSKPKKAKRSAPKAAAAA